MHDLHDNHSQADACCAEIIDGLQAKLLQGEQDQQQVQQTNAQAELLRAEVALLQEANMAKGAQAQAEAIICMRLARL